MYRHPQVLKVLGIREVSFGREVASQPEPSLAHEDDRFERYPFECIRPEAIDPNP
jgi:hypothetical protein